MKSKLVKALAAGALAAVPVTALGVSPASATDFSNPGVYMCADANYSGDCVYYAPGDYPEVDSAHNDVYSSVKIVGPYEAQLYSSTWWMGGPYHVPFDEPTLDHIKLNDEVSALKVVPMTDAQKEGVYLYVDANLGGAAWIKYTSDNPYIDSIQNDKVSSVRIFGRYKTTLFENGNYAGRSLTLDPSTGSPSIVNLDAYSFNDIVSSLMVTRY